METLCLWGVCNGRQHVGVERECRVLDFEFQRGECGGPNVQSPNPSREATDSRSIDLRPDKQSRTHTHLTIVSYTPAMRLLPLAAASSLMSMGLAAAFVPSPSISRYVAAQQRPTPTLDQSFDRVDTHWQACSGWSRE